MTYQRTTVRCTEPHLPRHSSAFFGARNLQLQAPAIVTMTECCYALSLQPTAMGISCTSRLLKRTHSAWALTYFLRQTHHSICLAKALKKDLDHPRESDLPLIAHADGSFLTLLHLISMLRSLLHKLGYNEDYYAGHSFRIGAATTAAATGLPDWLIKVSVVGLQTATNDTSN